MNPVVSSRDIELADKKDTDEDLHAMRHAKKPRKTISVAGLFAKKPRAEADQIVLTHHKKQTANEVLTAKAKRHPAYLDVKQATAAYSRGETSSATEATDAIHDELIARINNMDINGRSLDIPGLPSNATLKDMQQSNAGLDRPLEEDVVTISVTKPDGSTALKHVKLGDSIEKLENLIDDSTTKLTRLTRELIEVNKEIDSTLEKYVRVTESVEDAFQQKVKEFQSDVEAHNQKNIEEIEKARKEDKAYGVEANRKLQEFAASLTS